MEEKTITDFIDPFEDEDEPKGFWEKKHREIYTNVVDYNLDTLYNLINRGSIDLSPQYQRRLRWDKRRQSRLIESFLMNVPVPPIFLNEEVWGKYSVIDGKQRLSAIQAFFSDNLKLEGLNVFQEINGSRFSDLPNPIQTVLTTRGILRATIILKQSDPEIKYIVFQRLNTGGVNLTPQEIRNSVFPSEFNSLLIELSEDTSFYKLSGVKNKEKSRFYQEMRDVEFILRYFTFRDSWKSYSGQMRSQLDKFMDSHRNASSTEINEMRQDFLDRLAVIEASFGEYAFKRWDPKRRQWRRNTILASLFDAEIFACRNLTVEQVAPYHEEIIRGTQNLFLDPDFRQAIDAATNTPSYFKRRIEMMKRMIENVISS